MRYLKMAITTETQNQQNQPLYLAETINKIQQLPEPLVESYFSDYLTNLENPCLYAIPVVLLINNDKLFVVRTIRCTNR
jgi:hypothetical protein